MKTFIGTVVLFVVIASQSEAKIWTVDNNPGNSARDFSTLATAVGNAGVLDGDTIYVAGSSIAYSGSFTMSKRLYIFGPGFFLAQNSNTQANTAGAELSGTLTLASGSEGSIVQGMTFQTSVYINASVSNITLRRNYWNSAILHLYSGASSIIVVQNYMYYNYCCGPAINLSGSNTNVIISNNYIENPGGGGSITVASTGNAIITNNVLNGNVNLSSSTGSFDNNILRSGTFTASNITARNNIGNGTQFGTANGNQESVDMGTVFVSSGTSDGKWQILAEGPADGTGLSGEDCGMFGGSSPYVLSGMPPIPSIYFFSAPVSGSALQGLPVTIKVKSRN